MNKDIINRNGKGEYHGYIELYNLDGKLWFKCFFNNTRKIGYEEYHYYISNGKLKKIFHI